MQDQMEKKLRTFLNMYWLRPELCPLLAYKSKAFADVEFASPSIDISCGDGLFTFVHLGGEFADDFDCFQATRAKEFKHESFVDIYDSFEENYAVEITRPPLVRVDYATDWKQALLDRAGKLGLYNDLVLHDNNVLPLPFADDHFSTIYSNSAYWVVEVEKLVSDIRRILKPGGTAILEVMTPYYLETLDELEGHISAEAMNILDRKRRATMPGRRVYSDWKRIFTDCGFRVEDARCVYPDKVLIDILNIGLRPISHLLVRMAEPLSFADRRDIKSEWVDIFFTLFRSFLDLPQTYPMERAPYISFVLKK
jgi:SAM-dependent methyltransferase